jgi:hypothetical protein
LAHCTAERRRPMRSPAGSSSPEKPAPFTQCGTCTSSRPSESLSTTLQVHHPLTACQSQTTTACFQAWRRLRCVSAHCSDWHALFGPESHTGRATGSMPEKTTAPSVTFNRDLERCCSPHSARIAMRAGEPVRSSPVHVKLACKPT